MNDVVRINLQALNWTGGGNAFFDIMIAKGTGIHIDWDDDSTNLIIGTSDWQRVEHTYSERARKAEDAFHISITAEGKGTIFGIRNWSIDMITTDINLNQCNALRRLIAPRLDNLDVNCCPLLRELDITGGKFERIDLTRNAELEIIVCDFAGLTRLDLSECKMLKTLSCRSCWELMHIGLGNDSMIEAFIYNNETPVTGKCMRHLERIIQKNNGTILKET